MAKKKSTGQTKAEGRMWQGARNKQIRQEVIKNRRKVGKRNQGRPGA